MNHCDVLVNAAIAIRGTNPCDNSVPSLMRGIDFAECCRISGRDDLAAELIASVESFPLASESPISDLLRHFRNNATLPPLLIRGLNFAAAMSKHALDGFRRCSKKQIEARLEICEGCPQLIDNHCGLCGCACIEENRLTNKLALKSSECPIQKWGKL